MKEFLSGLALSGLLLGGLSHAALAGGSVTINEIRIDQSSADDDEYFELTGTPSTSLDGLTYIVIGDDGGGSSGIIESVTDLTGSSIPADGFFFAAEASFDPNGPTPDLVATLNFENSDNVTHLLVSGFTGSNGDDLDTNDDGILDVTPWTSIVDDVALIEEANPPSGTEFHYGTTIVGPDPDGGFVPAHAFRCPDTTGAFDIGDEFNFAFGIDTPGSANSAPVIDAQPVPLTVCEGAPASFFVDVNAGTVGTTFQWRLGGIDLVDGGTISGATTDTLNISATVALDGGMYDCVIANGCGMVTSDAVLLDVSGVTTITSQPRSFCTFDGANAVFRVSATGLDPFTYTWRKDNVDLVNGGNVSGADTDILFLSPVSAADNGVYTVVVTSGCGMVTSTGATLTVKDSVPTGIVINEIRIDQSGSDADEYFELAGDPNTSLDGLFYVVIGDSTANGSGTIEAAVSLDGGVIPADGRFLATELTYSLDSSCGDTAQLIFDESVDNGMNFENGDNVTHLLVAGYTGIIPVDFVGPFEDVDFDNDCTQDVSPWFALLDDVSLMETAPPDCLYGSETVGPDGAFVPAHVYRCPDVTGPFVVGEFSLCGSFESPGLPNPEDVKKGNVNGGAGAVTDVLFLNGDSGATTGRTIDISVSTDPFSLTIDAPPSLTTAAYVVYFWGTPQVGGSEESLPASLGTIGLPTPLTGNSPQPIRIARTINSNALGPVNWPAAFLPLSDAPTTLASVPAGAVPISGITAYAQGIIFDPDSPSGLAAVTNGFCINLNP